MTSCIDPAIGKYALDPDEIADPERRRALTQHLRDCEHCRLLTQRYQTFVGLTKHETANHLSFKEIISFVDEPSTLSADVQTRIESHLLVCHRCQSLTERVPSLDDLVKTFNATEQVPPGTEWDKSREQEVLRRIEETVRVPKDANGSVSDIAGDLMVTERIRRIIGAALGQQISPRLRIRLRTLLYATLLLFVSVGFLYFFFWQSKPNISDQVSQDRRANQQSSPVLSATPTPERRTTAAPTPTAAPLPTASPLQRTPILDSQDVAVVIDPSRALEPRQRVLLTHSYIRFSIHLKGDFDSNSYRAQLIDEERGIVVAESKIISTRNIRSQRRFVLLVEAKSLVNKSYTLRVTGMDASGKTTEVFTSYFEIVR